MRKSLRIKVAVPVRGAGRIKVEFLVPPSGLPVAVPVRGAGRIFSTLETIRLLYRVAVPVRGAGRIYKKIQSGAGNRDAFCDPCIGVYHSLEKTASKTVEIC